MTYSGQRNFVCLSACFGLSVCLFVCLSVCLLAHSGLSVCLFVYLFSGFLSVFGYAVFLNYVLSVCICVSFFLAAVSSPRNGNSCNGTTCMPMSVHHYECG